jgi:hypothetical protein
LDAERITYKNKEDNAGASFQRNMNRIQNECFKEDLISSIDTSRKKFHKKNKRRLISAPLAASRNRPACELAMNDKGKQ